MRGQNRRLQFSTTMENEFCFPTSWKTSNSPNYDPSPPQLTAWQISFKTNILKFQSRVRSRRSGEDWFRQQAWRNHWHTATKRTIGMNIPEFEGELHRSAVGELFQAQQIPQLDSSPKMRVNYLPAASCSLEWDARFVKSACEKRNETEGDRGTPHRRWRWCTHTRARTCAIGQAKSKSHSPSAAAYPRLSRRRMEWLR